MKNWMKILFGAALFVTLTGCASITRYSVESYQGLLPAEDHAYVFSE